MLGQFLRKLVLCFFVFLCSVLMTKLAYSDNEGHPVLHTLKPGTLIVATYFTNPPFEYLKDEKEIGFEVDLIKEIAKRLHLHLEFKKTQWEKIINELRENHYDLIMGAITINKDREKIIAFSKPYMTTTLSIVINKNKTPQVKTITDLSKLTIGVQAATTDFNIAKHMQKKGQIHGIKIYPFKNFNLAIEDLIAGRVGAVMKVFPVSYYYVEHHPELHILSAVPNAPQPLGFGMNQANQELVKAVNKAQAEMQADGTYEKIYKKWFGNDSNKN
ncbi:cystine/glutamine-binding periplasmic protein [Legionella steigerwaltii]|uniref:Cystine/glutamine-binding periplasmic protein n=1 Tax=Legionella steigerwaltii TaxID=460 RepID=A0A378L4P8_9GAMM|nr:ABC transporter substrate-binding protein [Legionella steigerwaltii]KTD69911.1 cystine/glutamine-binding periplasmic protein [Legionella steigerwaltii]STY21776.1 cystine/glutamine-binding periplasmic protein [Legionella steigerwaltii]